MKILLAACLTVWLGAVGFGTSYLYNYENTPGAEQTVQRPAAFPSQSRIRRDTERPTLIVFAHPQCPCTRATINELSKLMTDAQGQLAVHVLFVKPADFSEDWAETELWKKAAAIPGVEVAIDNEGQEAELFKAQTSGINLLYDKNGNLLFRGGITSSRGHEGDNAGRSSILDFVTHNEADHDETPIFGCPLNDARNCPQETEGNK